MKDKILKDFRIILTPEGKEWVLNNMFEFEKLSDKVAILALRKKYHLTHDEYINVLTDFCTKTLTEKELDKLDYTLNK